MHLVHIIHSLLLLLFLLQITNYLSYKNGTIQHSTNKITKNNKNYRNIYFDIPFGAYYY